MLWRTISAPLQVLLCLNQADKLQLSQMPASVLFIVNNQEFEIKNIAVLRSVTIFEALDLDWPVISVLVEAYVQRIIAFENNLVQKTLQFLTKRIWIKRIELNLF